MCSCRDGAQSARDAEEREGELLCLKIKAQLEDLFTDSHLAEDGFLLKHVQKNKQGYVSLKLLTCLRKIKVLTKNWYMTLAGAVHSDVLEVNDDCTKVRRIEPLPEWLQCSPTSKLLLAWNITAEKIEEGPEQALLFKRILQKFSAHGSVTSLWILHPGKELPKELRCYAKRHKELGQHLCAVVKFDNLEAVRKAYSALKAEEEESHGEGMCVVTLGFQSRHHISEDEPSEENNENQPGESQENQLESSEDSFQEEPPSSVKVSDETPDTSQAQESTSNSVQRTFDQILPSFSGLNPRLQKTLASADPSLIGPIEAITKRPLKMADSLAAEEFPSLELKRRPAAGKRVRFVQKKGDQTFCMEKNNDRSFLK
ncbi:la-related protein 6-like [Symphorus nematophorus]